MTLRTTSATRRTVVSRSSEVASTSATSSSSDSTGKRSDFVRTEPIVVYDSSRVFSACREAPLVPLFPGHHTNIGQVAIFLGVVEAVADHKFVGNLEPDVVALERQFAPRWFVEQSGHLQRPGLTCLQHLFQVRHRQTGIQNVLYKDYVLVLECLINILK